ncbi:MAG TPA: pyruvate formate lyase family protein, partial [Acholeplasmataceae bacterium]|nr:pyruvate formate lyase family protein [Acholeplasmataceae bacterium]
MNAWQGFKKGTWMNEVNVRDFMINNYKEYMGDASFLAGPTDSSIKLNQMFEGFLEEEKKNGGVIELDTHVVASITSHGPGYIDKDLEKIVGLQTDKPFKRAFHPYGGIQVATKAAEAYG